MEVDYSKRPEPKSKTDLEKYRKIEQKAFDLATDRVTLQVWSDMTIQERTLRLNKFLAVQGLEMKPYQLRAEFK